MKTVWFTKLLSEHEVQLVQAFGIKPLIHPLIQINVFSGDEIIPKIKNAPKPDALIFTSKNGALSFLKTDLSTEKDFLNIPFFCLGDATAEPFQKAGCSAHISDVPTGEGLAEFVAKSLPSGATIWHFCSTIKRPETGNTLTRLGYHYIPIESYETVAIPEIGFPDTPYDAVAFYSPSAVLAFVQLGKNDDSIPKLAIGNTTASELRANKILPVYVAEEASTEGILALLKKSVLH